MKAALSILNGRIAPVFDSSRQALVIEMEGGGAGERHEVLSPEAPLATARHLVAVGVRMLVCGAISAEVAALLAAEGVLVVPFVAGDVGEVIAACATGDLPRAGLLMPGCSLEQAEALRERFRECRAARGLPGSGSVRARRVR